MREHQKHNLKTKGFLMYAVILLSSLYVKFTYHALLRFYSNVLLGILLIKRNFQLYYKVS